MIELARIDTKLVAIIVSCIVLSTLVVITIIRPKGEDLLLLLGNEHPEALLKRPGSIGLDSGLTYSIMATSDLERLDLRFFSLYEKDLGLNLSKPIDLDEYPIISALMEKASLVGGEPEITDGTAMIGEIGYDAKVIDFSGFLSIFCEPSLISSLPVTFMLLSDGEELRYFEGSPGFFLDGEENLDYLAYSRNEEKSEFFREGTMIKGGPTISDAPLDGVLSFDDVRADERFSATFSVDMETDALRQLVEWTPDVHLAEVLKGHADGSLELLLINVMARGLEDEG